MKETAGAGRKGKHGEKSVFPVSGMTAPFFHLNWVPDGQTEHLS